MMLGERHTSVEIILVDQLQDCGENIRVARRHLVDIISVPHDQSLENVSSYLSTCADICQRDVQKYDFGSTPFYLVIMMGAGGYYLLLGNNDRHWKYVTKVELKMYLCR